MGLESLLGEKVTPSTLGSPCAVASILDQLQEPYLGAVKGLLASSTSADSLMVRLRAAGFKVGATTIRLHRRDVCSCPKGND